jgi:hypothetical protein
LAKGVSLLFATHARTRISGAGKGFREEDVRRYEGNDVKERGRMGYTLRRYEKSAEVIEREGDGWWPSCG